MLETPLKSPRKTTIQARTRHSDKCHCSAWPSSSWKPSEIDNMKLLKKKKKNSLIMKELNLKVMKNLRKNRSTGLIQFSLYSYYPVFLTHFLSRFLFILTGNIRPLEASSAGPSDWDGPTDRGWPHLVGNRFHSWPWCPRGGYSSCCRTWSRDNTKILLVILIFLAALTASRAKTNMIWG